MLETRRGIGVFVKEFSFEPLLDNLAYGLRRRAARHRGDHRRSADARDGHDRPGDRADRRRTISPICARCTNAMRQRAERSESFAEEDRAVPPTAVPLPEQPDADRLIEVFWPAFYKAADFANSATRPDADLARPSTRSSRPSRQAMSTRPASGSTNTMRGITEVIAEQQKQSTQR